VSFDEGARQGMVRRSGLHDREAVVLGSCRKRTRNSSVAPDDKAMPTA
jgi:hypothetical protein